MIKYLQNQSEPIIFTSMKNTDSLLNLSYEHRWNTILAIAENRTALRVARIVGDKDRVLRLKMQKQELEAALEYHEQNIKISKETNGVTFK